MKTWPLGRILRWGLLIYLLIAVISGILVPIFGRRVGKTLHSNVNTSPAPDTQMVCVIDDNTEALKYRLRVIEEARREIILSTFDFRDDQSGRAVMAALKRAADRGVQVRILIDGVAGQMLKLQSPTFRALAAQDGVEVNIYNPMNLLKPWRMNYRMHDKYLTADNRVFILGGRNTKDLSLLNGHKLQDMDRDVVVYAAEDNPDNAIYQVQQYFRDIWNEPCNRMLSHRERKSHEARLEELDGQYEDLRQKLPEVYSGTDWKTLTVPVKNIYFLSNPTEARNKIPQMWRSLKEVLDWGTEIIIQTPYVICSEEMYNGLTELAHGGNRVEIITNKPESGANGFGCSDYLNHKQDILDTGAEVYEFSGAHSLHAKTMLVDHRFSLVGSFNLDMRSAYLNTEAMLVIDSPEINETLRGSIEENMTQSNHVLPDGREIPGENYVAPSFTTGKKLYYGFLRCVMPPFRHLL